MSSSFATPDVLSRARDLVEPSLRSAVGSLVDQLRLPADYHFGWVSADGSPADAGSGKGIRPALAVLGAAAANTDESVAVPVGVAVELVHNFSLVHDDIIDADAERRHRLTVWKQFSIGDAVIVGDAMHTLAFQTLLEHPGPAGSRVAAQLAEATSAMIRGQSSDMSFATRDHVSLEDCLQMEADKTGALLAFSIAGGATLANASQSTIDSLHQFGIELGVAFQAHDDVLGVWGEPAVTGKAAGNDIRERKRSVPIVLALSASGASRQRLLEIFDADVIEDTAVTEAVSILDSVGAREATSEIAADRLSNAIAALAEADIDRNVRDEMVELARFVVERDH